MVIDGTKWFLLCCLYLPVCDTRTLSTFFFKNYFSKNNMLGYVIVKMKFYFVEIIRKLYQENNAVKKGFCSALRPDVSMWNIPTVHCQQYAALFMSGFWQDTARLFPVRSIHNTFRESDLLGSSVQAPKLRVIVLEKLT